QQPEGDGFAVVRSPGVWVLGRQAVVDAEDRDVERLREAPVARIHARRRTDGHGAAVEVEVDAAHAVGCEHAHRYAGDLARLREVVRLQAEQAARGHRLADPADALD